MIPRRKADRPMGLTICNGHPSTIWVTIAYANRDHCANAGGFIKEGWWTLHPGVCTRVYAGSLKNINRNWFYYAHTSKRKLEWAGNYGTNVPSSAFYQCWNNPQGNRVRYRKIDINSYDDYTLTLN
jgi:uncharacterized membrane protein